MAPLIFILKKFLMAVFENVYHKCRFYLVLLQLQMPGTIVVMLTLSVDQSFRKDFVFIFDKVPTA